MPTLSLTNPTALTVITAGLHSTNYSAIQSLLNGGLANDNISPGAAIAPTKLATNASVSDVLRGDGAWTPGWTLIDHEFATGNTFDFVVPQTYTNLRIVARVVLASAGMSNIFMTFNGVVVGSNYNTSSITTIGTTVSGNQFFGAYFSIGQAGSANSSQVIIEIPNYKDSDVHSFTAQWGAPWDGSNLRSGTTSGHTNFTSAITDIRIGGESISLALGCQAWLYGA